MEGAFVLGEGCEGWYEVWSVTLALFYIKYKQEKHIAHIRSGEQLQLRVSVSHLTTFAEAISSASWESCDIEDESSLIFITNENNNEITSPHIHLFVQEGTVYYTPVRIDNHCDYITLSNWRAWKNLLSENENQPLNSLSLVTGDFHLSGKINQIEEKSLYSIFHERAVASPAQTILLGSCSLTYQRLLSHVEYITTFWLTTYEPIQSPFVIGVLMDRSVLFIATVFAILRVGGTFVPLETSWPQHRIEYVVQHSGARCVLTSDESREKRFHCPVHTIQLPLEKHTPIVMECPRNDNIDVWPCILYTSGSTGNPKGVCESQRAILNRCQWMWREFPSTKEEVMIQKTSIGFVDSLWELFGSLLYGIPLLVVPNGVSADAMQLIDWIQQHRVTRLVAVPSFYRAIADLPQIETKLSTLKYAVSSGEVLSVDVVQQIQSKLPLCTVLNLYGSTEVTADATYFVITKENSVPSVPIGEPIDNTKVYVLSSDKEPVPAGVVGALYIGGAALSAGYWSDTELTSRYFMEHPLTKEIMYCTGDLAYYGTQGTLYYCGRSDSQVKIRGHRVEILDVETNLEALEMVKQAAVICVPVNHSNQLVAFIVHTEEYSEEKAKRLLSQKVPYYMLPWRFYSFNQFPLTSSGKIDKIELRRYYEETLNQIQTNQEKLNCEEAKLTSWLQEILRVQEPCLAKRFTELGGDSLSAIRLLSKISDEFGCSLNVQELFACKSMNELIHIVQADSVKGQCIPKIVPLQQKEALLSFSQRGLWFLEQLNSHNEAFIIPVGLSIKGKLNCEAFTCAVRRLLQRHSILRSRFSSDKTGHPIMSTTLMDDMKISDVYDMISYERDTEAMEHIEKIRQSKINILDESTYPCKISLLYNDNTKIHFVLIQFHHIVSDGWSVEVCLRDLSHFYRQEVGEISSSLSKLSIQYTDYSHWQYSVLSKNSSLYHQLIQYWENQLRHIEDTCGELPIDFFPDTKATQRKSNDISLSLSQEVTQHIASVVQQNGTTKFAFLMSCLVLMMKRCSSSSDITITTPAAMRNQSTLEGMIGMFVNTLIIRILLDDSTSLSEFLQNVSSTLLQALAHSEMPFDVLVEKFYRKERQVHRTPFSQVMIVQEENAPERLFHLGSDVQVENLSLRETSASNDVTLFVDTNDSQAIRLRFRFACDIFSEATQHRLANLFVHLVSVVCEASQDAKVSMIPMLSTSLQRQIAQWNKTKINLPNKSLFQIIREREAENPNGLAVKDGKASITYQRLVQGARGVASRLQEMLQGESGCIIGLYATKGIEAIVGMIGILAAGCAYTPLDPSFPLPKTLYIIEQSKMKAILASSESYKPKGFTIPCECIRSIMNTVNSKAYKEPPLRPLHEHIAAVLFTSGTTNQPKGVQLTHTNIQSLVYKANWIQISSADIVSQLNTLTFDLALCEIFSALLQGAGLCIIEKSTLLDAHALSEFIMQEKISICVLPTSVLHIIARYYPSALSELRYVIFGGERANTKLTNKILRSNPPKHLVNIYGPTEITFACSYHELTQPLPETEPVPIGKPMSNSTLYILDSNGQLVPPNITGEIVVGGTKVAHGYLSLSSDTFFTSDLVGGTERLYRTGDYGKYNDEGLFYFVSRKDRQVKIRGFRVEPEEVNEAILSCSGVDLSIVIPVELPCDEFGSEKYLIGYYQGSCEIESLREYLVASIPDYMIPRILYPMKQLPLTTRGKIDAAALPTPTHVEHTMLNNTEKQVQHIFEQLLGVKVPDKNTSFFQAGGNSLLTMRLLAELTQRLHLAITLKDIFQNPTIEAIAKFHSNENQSNSLIANSLDASNTFPLSRGQLRIWVDQSLAPKCPHYNVPCTLRFRGKLNLARLSQSLQELFGRYHILRAVILPPSLTEDEPMQQYAPMENLSFELSVQRTSQHCVHNEIEAFHMIPFDISNSSSPLFRFVVFSLSDDENILCITFHHFICDGWSLHIFERELAKAYTNVVSNTEQRTNVQHHYHDVVAHEQNILAHTDISQHKDYLFWREHFTRFQKLELSFRTCLEVVRDPLAVKVTNLLIPKASYDRFILFCKGQQCTAYMGLLSLFYIVLYRYTMQEHISVASVIANRSFKSTEEMIGFLVNNSMSCVSFEKGSLSSVDVFAQVKEFIVSAICHSQLDFSVLLDTFADQQGNKAPSMKDILGVVFILQENQAAARQLTDSLSMESHFVDLPFSKFDVVMECIPLESGELRCMLSYSTLLYPNAEGIMSRLLLHFQQLMTVVQDSPERPISDIDYFTAAEHQSIELHREQSLQSFSSSYSIPRILKELYPNPQGDQRVLAQSIGRTLNVEEFFFHVQQAGELLLREYNIQIGDRVIVLLDKSIALYVVIIAIVSIGAVYVPVDALLPLQRIHHVVDLTSGTLLISEDKFSSICQHLTLPQWIVTPCMENMNLPYDSFDLFHERETEVEGDDICYILHTSGSTGTPKGVSISHNNVVKRFYEFPIIPQSFIRLQACSVLFDPSISDIFSSLFKANRLVLVPFSLLDTQKMFALIQEYNIEMISVSTSLLELLIANTLEIFANLKAVSFGGSIVDATKLRKLSDRYPNCLLYHLYGPTETTFAVSGKRLTKDDIQSDNVTIGRMLPPSYYYIVDKNRKLVPQGIEGELIIGGPVVSRWGYMNMASQDKYFFPDPFLPKQQTLMYATGDIVYEGREGELFFRRRKDSQIKVGGYRVEPEEIRLVAGQLEGVELCFVSLVQSELCMAYCGSATAEEIIAHLQRSLPYYMIPRVVYVHEIPLQTNTKIDIKKLQRMIAEQLHGAPSSERQEDSTLVTNLPSQEIEEGDFVQQLRHLWEQALGFALPNESHSFLQVGGTSIRLLKLFQLLTIQFPSLSIHMSDLLLHSSFQAQRSFLWKQMKSLSKTETTERSPQDTAKIEQSNDIAVVGMDCFVPGARHCDAFWENLKAGVDCITREACKPPTVLAGGVLTDVEHFDHRYFRMTRKEASLMDPQHRWLLECTSNALQHAGIDPTPFQEEFGAIGIFVSLAANTYHQNTASSSSAQNFQQEIAGMLDSAGTRTAFALGLLGPAMAIQTACSSSLVALHTACQSILVGDCFCGVVSGTAITFPQLDAFEYEEGMILSPDGKCKAFDVSADGIVSGNGVGSVALMRYEDAVRGGFVIHGVIKGTAVNNDGREKASYHSGNITQHVAVIEKALERAQLPGGASDVQYIEAHGAGTVLGDLIEVSAFSQVYKGALNRPVVLGSVKSNVGHLGPAAGITGLIKTLLAMKHHCIPRTLHFQELHPHIASLSTAFVVPHENKDWVVPNGLRTAAIHSFGQGGTNAHCIVQESPPRDPQQKSESAQLFSFSAASRNALTCVMQDFVAYVRSGSAIPLNNIAWSLQVGRSALYHRKTFVASSHGEAIDVMERYLQQSDSKPKKRSFPSQETNTKSSFVFLFPGQGTEFRGMIKTLYHSFPPFREAIEYCHSILQTRHSLCILPALLDQTETPEDISGSLWSQLSIFMTSYSLAQLLLACGIHPAAMIGHSFGEYACACISGVMSVSDALFLLLQRGHLIHQTQPGRMIAVRSNLSSSLQTLAALHHVDIAAQNSHQQIVFSGPQCNVENLEKALQAEDYKVTPLSVSHGFHSQCMDTILPAFEEHVKSISLHEPRIPFLSSVTGKWITKQQSTSVDYWVSHLRSPVMFSGAVEETLTFLHQRQTRPVIIQVGPGFWMRNVFRWEIQRFKETLQLSHDSSLNICELPEAILHPKRDHANAFLTFLGSQWEHGLTVNWKAIHTLPEKLQRVELPFYPYERVLCDPSSLAASTTSTPLSIPSSTTVSLLQFNQLQEDVQHMRKAMDTMQSSMQQLLSMNQQLLYQLQTSAIPHIAPISPWRQTVQSLLSPLQKQTNHPHWGLFVSLTRRHQTEHYLFGDIQRCAASSPIQESSPAHIHESKIAIGCLSTCFVLAIFEEMIHSKEISRCETLSQTLPPSWNLPLDVAVIQLHHLASHTSALPCLPSQFTWNSNKKDPSSICHFGLSDLRKELCECELSYKPGTQSTYSPLGIALLAVILTFRGKNSFDLPDLPTAFQSLLTTKVLRPQQLFNTTVRPSHDEIVQGFCSDSKQKAQTWYCGPVFTLADGIYSSLHDLIHFLQLQCAGNRPIGHYLLQKQENGVICWSVGLTPASSCWIGYSPGKQSAVVLCFNTEMEISLELSKLGERCLRLLDDEAVSIHDGCSIIDGNVLRIWKGEITPPSMMDHLFDDPDAAPDVLHCLTGSLSLPKTKEEIEDVIEQIVIEILWGRKESLDINPTWTFHDLGIDSLQLLVVASEIQRKLPSYKLSVTSLFDFPSIQSLAAHLFHTNENESSSLLPLELKLPNFSFQGFTVPNSNASKMLPIILKSNRREESLEAIIRQLQQGEAKNIEQLVLKHGGVLLRGLPASSPEDFGNLVSELFADDSSRDYKDGISPRSSVLADKVFTSTEYPSQYDMDLHNEMSYSPSPPNFILFFCHTAPEPNCGGETPIAFSKDIYDRMDPKIRSIFKEKGILYVTNLPSQEGGHQFGLSWQVTYGTDDPRVVEHFCTRNGISFQWISPQSGEAVDESSDVYLTRRVSLRTERRCPAVRKDETTGDYMWFNHAHLFHPTDLPKTVRKGMEQLVPIDLFPKNCYFGDRTTIPTEYLDHVRKTMRSCEVSFSWEQGDLLLLHNKVVCHGRHKFTGPRKILVSMK